MFVIRELPAAAKSKGGKGAAGNLQICIPLRMTCQQRRSFPCRLPLASDTQGEGSQ